MKEKRNGRVLVGKVMFLLFIAFGAQTWASGGNMDKPDLVVRKQDSGKEFSLKSGQVIQIQLEAMGGAGYWWYVQNLDPRYFELLSENTRPASEGRVGGPVLALWTFQAKGTGDAEIKMDYFRSWEGVASASEHFRVKIHIE